MKCPICEVQLLGQEDYLLKRCEQCSLWFEVQGDGELIPLRPDPFYPR
jgi:hypothetical protein